MKATMTPEKLLPGADEVVRRMLPMVLESRGLSSAASSLRELPVLKDIGSVTFAVAEVSRAARSAGPAGVALRLCSEAAMAAVRGDARKFALFVRTAAASLRTADGESELN